MSTTAYMYRRDGTYYFRWSIPIACRMRMPPGCPHELRLSLHATKRSVASYLAARLWLAARDMSHSLLVSNGTIRYNDLVNAIKERARMGAEPTELATVSLAEVAGTVDLASLKDAMARLQALQATFYAPISHGSAGIWRHCPRADGGFDAELVERIEDFIDGHAMVPAATVTEAFAAKDNLLEIHWVRSNLPGMSKGDEANKQFFEVRLDVPQRINISALRVEVHVASAIPRIAPAQPSAKTQQVAGPSCAAMKLSEGLAEWLRTNQTWSSSTRTSYKGAIKQFIEIVGDKQTTELTAQDFTHYDKVARNLPKNWLALRNRTGKTLEKLAEGVGQSDFQPTAAKTLQAKAVTIKLFFEFLEGQGYWHGIYGKKILTGIKQKRGKKTLKPCLTNAELRDLFIGDGFAVLEKAKFALYVWGSLLLLYTGARPSEISQLTGGDFMKDEQGTSYIRILATDDDKSAGGKATKQIKTLASDRSVPIHPNLIDLGLLDFAAKFQGDERIFPEAFRHIQKSSREIGDWFNQKLLRATSLKQRGITLYSFRHTVIERFKADATLDFYACAFIGHSTAEDGRRASKIFSDEYGRAHTPTVLAKPLHPLLDFEIDWSSIKTLVQKKDREWANERHKLKNKPTPKKTARPRKKVAVASVGP